MEMGDDAAVAARGSPTDHELRIPVELVLMIFDLDNTLATRMTSRYFAEARMKKILRSQPKPYQLHFGVQANDLGILDALLKNDVIMSNVNEITIGCANFTENDFSSPFLLVNAFFFHEGDKNNTDCFSWGRDNTQRLEEEKSIRHLTSILKTLCARQDRYPMRPTVRFGCTFRPNGSNWKTLPFGLERLLKQKGKLDKAGDWSKSIYRDQGKFLDWALYLLFKAIARLDAADGPLAIDFQLFGQTVGQEVMNCAATKREFKKYAPSHIDSPVFLGRTLSGTIEQIKMNAMVRAGSAKSMSLEKRLSPDGNLERNLSKFIGSIDWLDLPLVGRKKRQILPGAHSLWNSRMLQILHNAARAHVIFHSKQDWIPYGGRYARSVNDLPATNITNLNLSNIRMFDAYSLAGIFLSSHRLQTLTLIDVVLQEFDWNDALEPLNRRRTLQHIHLEGLYQESEDSEYEITDNDQRFQLIASGGEHIQQLLAYCMDNFVLYHSPNPRPLGARNLDRLYVREIIEVDDDETQVAMPV